MTPQDKIQNGYNIFKRGGYFIVNVFQKDSKILTGNDCMKIKDIYGFRPESVVLLAISHGFAIDKEEFAKLLNEEEEKRKNMRMCKMDLNDGD